MAVFLILNIIMEKEMSVLDIIVLVIVIAD